MWMVVRQILPCDAMAIFLPEPQHDQVAVRYAAGHHAARLRTLRSDTGSGIAGWVAVTLRPAVNADPAIEAAYTGEERVPALRACLAVPIVESASLVAVLALYRSEGESFTAFSDDHVRLLELLCARLSAPLANTFGAEPLAAPAATLTLIRGGARS